MKLQLQDVNGNVVEEKTLVLGEGDTLIMRFPDKITAEQGAKAVNFLEQAIKDNKEVIGLPDSIDFLVIKTEK